MKLVHVTLRSIQIISVKPRDMSIELAVSFDDSALRRIIFKVSTIEAEATAAQIFSKIRAYEQGLHQNKESETILDSLVSINFRSYPETFEKLYNFLSRAQQRLDILKSGKSEGYISTILSLNAMKMEFTGKEL